MQLTTFKVGLKSRDFVVSLAKNPPKMMTKMLLKAQKYMNAKEIREERRTIIEDKKRSVQTNGSMTGVKGKTRKLPKR